MPQNGSRGADTKKSKGSSASNNEHADSNVVFGDAKVTRKAKHGSTAEDLAKKEEGTKPGSNESPPKNSDTRKLVSNT